MESNSTQQTVMTFDISPAEMLTLHMKLAEELLRQMAVMAF